MLASSKYKKASKINAFGAFGHRSKALFMWFYIPKTIEI